MKIALGIPLAGSQPVAWWSAVCKLLVRWHSSGHDIILATSQSAMPDDAKNKCIRALENVPNLSLTSYNRNWLVKEAIDYRVDALFFLDHDTVPPEDVLERLLALDVPFASGIYYNRGAPHLPLIYKRTEHGTYRPIVDFERGSILSVDAVGLGCALIRMEVFQAIRENYRVFHDVDEGALVLYHKDDIVTERIPSRFRKDTPRVYTDGKDIYAIRRLLAEPPADFAADYPYFGMVHGRTEDVLFCERVKRCGYEIVVDTDVVCQHLHLMPVTDEAIRKARDAAKISGMMPVYTLPEHVIKAEEIKDASS